MLRKCKDAEACFYGLAFRTLRIGEQFDSKALTTCAKTKRQSSAQLQQT